MKLLFLKRGYPERLISNKMKKVKFNQYHFNGKYKEVRRVFRPGPMVLFRSSKKLRSYLVRAKLYPAEKVVGSLNVINDDA